MRRTSLLLAIAVLLPGARVAAAGLAPGEIVAAAPASDWIDIPVDDLLVMTLAPDTKGGERRIVIQLMPPPFSQGWIGNIRKLAAAHWWDGTSVNRVQDNYVAQWGDPYGDDRARAKPLPPGLVMVPESEYTTNNAIMTETVIGPRKLEDYPALLEQLRQANARDLADRVNRSIGRDAYASRARFIIGWPVAQDGGELQSRLWPVHCYAMVGVGRDLPPDTGSGAELYAVIGTPPRHLDRNIALVGRVIDGIERLSSLPRGTEALGFYKTAAERVAIVSIRLASELPAGERPRFQYLSTESASFARYADARANRTDAFFVRPAGGADICNVPVPIRRKP